MNPRSNALPGKPAGVLRRLAALFYDGLLLLAVLFFATLIVLPFNRGEAIAPHNPLFTSYLFLVGYFYFAWCWIHGGQTLGMRAWKLRVLTVDGRPLGWWHALLRYLAAIPSLALGGLGYFWIWLDRESRAWHDRFSETVVIRTP